MPCTAEPLPSTFDAELCCYPTQNSKMFALAAPSSRNVACQATQPRHKGAKHHARSRPIKVGKL